MSDDMLLSAPIEGDGHYTSKSLQWVDLCPHMGAPEKALLRVLTNLTTEVSRTRRLKPVELQQMVFTGPVEVGEEPKHVSASGLLRLLRNLANLGQITGPRGEALTFSSRPNAQKRETSMAIWKHPKHDCGCPRNTFDALAITRGEKPDYPPASNIAGRSWAPTSSDVPGQEVDPRGQEVNPPGQEVDPRGQEVNPHTQRDLQEVEAPSSSPSTSSSSSSSPPTPRRGRGRHRAAAPSARPAGREDDRSAKKTHNPSPRALEIVTAAVRLWPRNHKAPSTSDRQRLAERVDAELASGGDERVIIRELSRDMSDVGDAMRVMMGSRTKVAGWGRNPDPRPDHTRHEVDVKRPWCGQCSEKTRMVHVVVDEVTGETRPGRCRQPVVDVDGATVACHPKATLPITFDGQGEDALEGVDVAAESRASLEEAAEAKRRRDKEIAAAKAAARQVQAAADRERKVRVGSRR